MKIVTNWANKPLPAIPGSVPNYEYVNGIKFDDRKRPPTPPPKPSRNSKIAMSP